MSRMKKTVIVLSIIILIVGIITGIHFLTRKNYTYNVRLAESVDSVLEAYEIIDSHVQEKSPGAKLIYYSVDLIGTVDITNRTPSHYRFGFGNSPSGKMSDKTNERYYVTLFVHENRMEVDYMKNVDPLLVVELGNPVIEIDIDEILNQIENGFDVDSIGELLKKEPKVRVGISTGLSFEKEGDRYQPEQNSWDVDVYIENRRTPEYNYYVNLNGESVSAGQYR